MLYLYQDSRSELYIIYIQLNTIKERNDFFGVIENDN